MKTLLLIGLLLLVACTTSINDSMDKLENNEKWDAFNACIVDESKVWDEESQKCIDMTNPDGCVYLEKFDDIESQHLPSNFEGYCEQLNAIGYCNDFSLYKLNNCGQVGKICDAKRWKITNYGGGITLCWN